MDQKEKPAMHKTPEQIREMKTRRARRALYLVTQAVLCDLCPTITREVGLKILQERRTPRTSFTPTAMQAGREMVADPQWRARFEEWVDEFWGAHRHGPSWSRIRNTEELWPEGTSASARRVVLHQLGAQRIIDGGKTPFGLKIRREES